LNGPELFLAKKPSTPVWFWWRHDEWTNRNVLLGCGGSRCKVKLK
jgi:hypothetical protein